MKLFKRKKQEAYTGRRAALGGGRPKAFSYYANRNEQDYNLGRNQPREQDTRKRERIMRQLSQRFGLLLVLLVLLVCVIDVLHVSSQPKIVPLTASSTNYFLQPTNTYQQAAAKLFADSVFNGNKITINTSAIQQSLKQQFPELSDVSITLPLVGHRPIVYVASTTPSLILRTKHGDFVLDNTGKALIAANQVADLSKLNLPTVVDQSGLELQSGHSALPSASVSFIASVLAELRAKSIPFDSLTLPPAAYEFDVKPSGVGYFVKFNMHDSTAALQQVGTYLAVRQRLLQQSITPAAYIDVRLAGRAYYK